MRLTKKTKETITKIAKEHSKKTFGYLDESDLESEIWIICMNAIQEYDKKLGPLENFLRKTVKNRLVNRFKDVMKTVVSPCPRCPFYSPGNAPSDCAKFGDDRHLCDRFHNYTLSVESRNSLLNVADSPIENKFYSENHLDQLASKETVQTIKRLIAKEYKNDLEKYLSGETLSNKKKEKLFQECRRIINDG